MIFKCSIIFAFATEMQAEELTSSNRTQNQRYLVMINLGVATQAVTASYANQRHHIQLNRIYHSFLRRSIVWRICVVVCNARTTRSTGKNSGFIYGLLADFLRQHDQIAATHIQSMHIISAYPTRKCGYSSTDVRCDIFPG